MAITNQQAKEATERFAAIVEAAKAKRLARQAAAEQEKQNATIPSDTKEEETVTLEAAAKEIATSEALLPTPVSQTNKNNNGYSGLVLNEDQEAAAELVLHGISCCIIGSAGTGKTTTVQESIRRLLSSGKVAPLRSSTKYLQEGMPGIAVVSFPNKAVSNIAKRMPKNVACVTIHKLLEFQPIFYDVQNSEGEWIKTMRFEPARTRFNPLPSSLQHLFIEESGTVSVQLHQQLAEALHPNTVIVYLGDIQQLPPVYGPAILGFKMLELATIELKEVYRQALESKILSFAVEGILAGKPLSLKEIGERWNKEGEFRISKWAKRYQKDDAAYVAGVYFNKMIDAGEFNYEEDMILIPHNVGMGTCEVNKGIAQKLGMQRGAEVHEIIAGFQKFYYAVGDKLLLNKQEAIVTKLVRNGNYGGGHEPLSPSVHLNRWGHYDFASKEDAKEVTDMSLEDMELLLASTTVDSGEVEGRKNQASHVLHYRYLDTPEGSEDGEIATTGEFMDSSFAYALSVHKAQGSEWKRVILLLHHSHAAMISRELLYTAVTRARESLYIICEPETFLKGIVTQRIKGNTLAEKAEYFKGKKEQLLEEES